MLQAKSRSSHHSSHRVAVGRQPFFVRKRNFIYKFRALIRGFPRHFATFRVQKRGKKIQLCHLLCPHIYKRGKKKKKRKKVFSPHAPWSLASPVRCFPTFPIGTHQHSKARISCDIFLPIMISRPSTIGNKRRSPAANHKRSYFYNSKNVVFLNSLLLLASQQ